MGREQVIRRTYDAMREGDLAALEAVLAQDARWRAVKDGPWNCENRATILRVTAEQRVGARGTVEEVTDLGERAIVGFRPHGHGDDAWPLDEGIRYVVVTFRGDGLIAEIKGCATRAVALEYAGAATG